MGSDKKNCDWVGNKVKGWEQPIDQNKIIISQFYLFLFRFPLKTLFRQPVLPFFLFSFLNLNWGFNRKNGVSSNVFSSLFKKKKIKIGDMKGWGPPTFSTLKTLVQPQILPFYIFFKQNSVCLKAWLCPTYLFRINVESVSVFYPKS